MSSIEELEAKIAAISAELESLKASPEPKWVPFPGEIIEVQPCKESSWLVRVASGVTLENGRALTHFNGKRSGATAAWQAARPLSDPNVIQLRPHTPGDPLPCGETHRVLYRMVSGEVGVASAKFLNRDDVTAWAPLPQVSP